MKRILLASMITAAVAAGAFGQGAGPGAPPDEALPALQELSGAQIGSLTVGDMLALAGRVSVAQQKSRYVMKAGMASFLLPGAGQLMVGDTLGGALWLTGDLLVFSGTVVGAYLALPSDVQLGLGYLTRPVGDIRALWEGRSVVDYLPSVGVMAGGMLVEAVMRHVSAHSAAREARDAVAKGRVTFKPRFGPMGAGMGMGMMMRMSF
jgi:hypothetical protein